MKTNVAAALSGIVTASFIGTWIILGIVGFFLFYLRRDAALKRQWFPRFVALVGFLFVLFATTLSVLSSRSLAGLGILVVVAPAVWLISYLNVKFTKFCDRCGTIAYQQNWFAPMNFCSRCGAELDAKPKFDDDLLE
jgi:hypothetical protein